MLLWAVLLALFRPVAVQEFGEIQQLLRFAYGSQVNSVMSSCCVIRQFQCPDRRPQRAALHQNVTGDLTQQFDRYRGCICSRGTRCILLFPPFFLPTGADSVTFDVSYVTTTFTTQYTCGYRGSRVLVCQYRQSVRTGLPGWILPGLGRYGPLEVLGSAGLLGEELEEAMEQMVETGLRPGLTNRACRRCVPLLCLVTLRRELQRFRVFTLLSPGTQRQRYHRCLRQNSIRPPPLPSVAPTTTRMPLLLPLTPAPDPTIPPSTTTATTATTRKTTTTTTPTSTTTTATTTTTSTTEPMTTTTASPPVTYTSTAQVTTPETTTTELYAISSTTTTAVVVTTITPNMSSTTAVTTTSTPVVITRILVGSGAATPSTSHKQNAVGDVLEAGGKTAMGGGGVAGVAMGTSVVMAMMVGCLIFLYRRHRRSQDIMGEVDTCAKVTTTAGKEGQSLKRKHFKARPLPSVSSKQAVIDGEEANEEEDKVDDDDDDDDSGDEEKEERYTSPPVLSAAMTKSSLQTAPGHQEEGLYASLDEIAINPSQFPAQKAPADALCGSSHTTSHAAFPSEKDSKLYYNTNTVISAKMEGGSPSVMQSNSYYNLKPEHELYVHLEHVAPTDAKLAGSSVMLQYEKPQPQEKQHVYSCLQTENRPAGEDGPADGDVEYLEPCALLTGSPSSRDKNDVSIPAHHKVIFSKTMSSASHVTSGMDRGHSADHHSVPGTDTAPTFGTFVSATDPNPATQPPVPLPRVDHDGYLLPMTSRTERRLL